MTLFLAGVAGSFTHCAGMCGPFVVAQTTARLNDIPATAMNEWQRLKGIALLPYHLGRLTTYAFLGVLVSSLTQAVVMTSGFKALNAFLLAVAGLLFLAGAAGEKTGGTSSQMPLVVRIQSFFSAKAGSFLSRPTGVNGYIAGILLGFLPCGLLYSALLIVSTADPLTAVAGMALFGIGTLPSLLMVSWWTSHAGRKMRPVIEKTGRMFMLANGLVLIGLAVKKVM